MAVRTHSDTLRILAQTGLQERLRLTTEHFMVLPSIVQATDLCVVMPGNIAQGFVETGGCVIVQPPFVDRGFTVSLHWSHRFRRRPGQPLVSGAGAWRCLRSVESGGRLAAEQTRRYSAVL